MLSFFFVDELCHLFFPTIVPFPLPIFTPRFGPHLASLFPFFPKTFVRPPLDFSVLPPFFVFPSLPNTPFQGPPLLLAALKTNGLPYFFFFILSLLEKLAAKISKNPISHFPTAAIFALRESLGLLFFLGASQCGTHLGQGISFAPNALVPPLPAKLPILCKPPPPFFNSGGNLFSTMSGVLFPRLPFF